MNLSDFDYNLPSDSIAQRPLPGRDAGKLLIMSRDSGHLEDRLFRDFSSLLRGDELLVFNNARVIPARLFGRRRGLHSQPPSKEPRLRREHLSAEIEVLLTRHVAGDTWQALVRPGRKIGIGEHIVFGDGELSCEVLARGEFGERTIKFSVEQGGVNSAIERLGHVPLPPYIRREDESADRDRYQTIFAKEGSAVAAPTAGLHFSENVLNALRARGIETCEITLDVGLGTFQAIHTERVEDHAIHSERYEISEISAQQICQAKALARPILAVGTTVVRTLEDAATKCANAGNSATIAAGPAEARIFIYPGHNFRIVDQMLTNFHLPRSSLLVLVAAFAGREHILNAYEHALRENYRFYSYGDCMLIR
jgi:S-adenosylmethionine:tRNA ribosyltransferase-isomerase